jgi:hypothetical protein
MTLFWLAQQYDEKCLLSCGRHFGRSSDLCHWKRVAFYHSRDMDLSERFRGVVDEAPWTQVAH